MVGPDQAAVDPVREEDAGHSLAAGEPGHRRTDRGHLASTIGGRDDRLGGWPPVRAPGNRQVAIVQRDRAYADPDIVWAKGRRWPLGSDKGVEVGPWVQLEGAHRPPFCRSRPAATTQPPSRAARGRSCTLS